MCDLSANFYRSVLCYHLMYCGILVTCVVKASCSAVTVIVRPYLFVHCCRVRIVIMHATHTAYNVALLPTGDCDGSSQARAFFLMQ